LFAQQPVAQELGPQLPGGELAQRPATQLWPLAQTTHGSPGAPAIPQVSTVHGWQLSFPSQQPSGQPSASQAAGGGGCAGGSLPQLATTRETTIRMDARVIRPSAAGCDR
jgi:hypothetical protein